MASSASLQDHNCSCLPFNIRDNNGHRDHHAENNNNAERVMMKQTEDLLASELNKLSVKERTEALEDVHCVGEELKETPEMMEKALADFAAALVVLLMKEGNKYQVYEIAVQQNRAYVEDDSFRLKFLRANFYDVDRSVGQMMRFLQMKATYFGIDKVASDITLDDLNQEDMEVLLSGHWHIQEGKDRSGRVIVHNFGNMQWKAENAIRAAYIIWMNIVTPELDEVQTKGIVRIIHNVAKKGQKVAMPGIDFMITVNGAYESFPIRCSTTHCCLHQHHHRAAGSEQGSSHFNSFLRKALQILSVYETVRSRIHVGHSMEIQYQLRTHGIPMESFPVDLDGKVREDIFFAWFDKYYQHHAQSKALLSSRGDEMDHSTSMIPEVRGAPMGVLQPPQGNVSAASMPAAVEPSVTPSENDVLFGRGKFAQYWPGNVKFREFIEKHSEDYNRLARNERFNRTIELTETLIGLGVRFFDKDDESGEWVEVDFEQARLKICQIFRTNRNRKPNVG